MYKCKKRQLDYLRRWRKKNPDYMSDYYWREVKPLTDQNRRMNTPGGRPEPITGSAMSKSTLWSKS